MKALTLRAMVGLGFAAVLLCIAMASMATEPKGSVHHNGGTQQQAQTADQSQQQAQTSANDYSSSSRFIALSNGAPIPPQCPAGLVPGKRGKRGLFAVVVGLSAVCVPPNEAEAAAIQAYRDHEIELARLAIERARAEAERDREAAARSRSEQSCERCLTK